MRTKNLSLGCLLALAAVPAFASLSTFQTFTGADYGVSTSGWGSSTSSGTISTTVPTGAVVVAAYLYSAYYDNGQGGGTLNGTAVAYGPGVPNATACCSLGSLRADVTSIVQAAVVANGGPSNTPFTLRITENNTSTTDGEMLVTVFCYTTTSDCHSGQTGADQTVAILDGFASVTGDTATLTLGAPSTLTTAAEMMIGDGFSCCGQESTIKVNGTTITNVAGNNDDCVDGGTPQNGCLITVGTELNGASSDPYSTLLPLYADDHERYNLTPQIPLGSTVITVNTANGSQDDNIFAAVFRISGDASVTTNNAPEPATFVLSGIALAGLGFLKLRRRSA